MPKPDWMKLLKNLFNRPEMQVQEEPDDYAVMDGMVDCLIEDLVKMSALCRSFDLTVTASQIEGVLHTARWECRHVSEANRARLGH